MLIEKSKIEVGSIISIKLQNGDEVIGKVAKLDDYGTITITKPLKVDMINSQQGPALIMTPTWLLTGPQQDDSDASFRINADHITTKALSNKDAAANYVKQTSSLVIPGAGSGLIRP